MPLAIGTRLGPYDILALLGKGGMGEVYRAADARLRREVAIKVLAANTANDEDLRHRFEREARAASALNHPNILTVYDIGRQDDFTYIVMELVNGESLREHIRSGAFPARKFVEIATQIADALAAAHQAGITHRDLKPENIMITRDGRVKILDFGLAVRAKTTAMAGDSTLSMLETGRGVLLGTVQYMSPEQARSGEVDYRSDQFSFGVILYEMASGLRPFDRPSVGEVLHAILFEEPLTIPERAPVPIPLRWMISRLMNKEASERYASTADLFRDIRAHRDHASLGFAAPSPSRFRITRGWIPYTAFALLILLGGLAQLFRHPAPGMLNYRYTPFALDAGMDSAPAWSPDGKTIAYLHDIDGVAQVLVRGVASSVPAQITRGSSPCRNPFWSHDGNRVFFISGAFLWSVGAAGGEPQKVLEDASHAAMSPHGKTIAFGKSGAGGELWIHSLNDGKVTKYPAPLKGQSKNRQVRFSPDGKKIGALWPSQQEHTLDNTFWILPYPPGPQVRSITLEASSFSWMPDSRFLIATKNSPNAPGRHLYWVDTETAEAKALTGGLGTETDVDISPDGLHVALTAGGVDNDLIEVPLDGSPTKILLSTSRSETSPSWSPDGTQFAYVQASIGGGSEIWVRSVQGAWSRPLFSSIPASSTYTNPKFSPDGQRIVYETWSSEGYLLWVASVGGGNGIRLTQERNHQHFPVWSPDGKWIAYRANVGEDRVLEKVPSGGGRPVALARTSTANSIVWSPTGEWLSYSDGSGLNLISSHGGEARRLLDRPSNSFGFSADGTKLYVVQPDGSQWTLWSIDVASGEKRMERKLEIAAEDIRGFSLRPDGKAFATSISVSHQDIWLLEGFEKPRSGFFSGWRNH